MARPTGLPARPSATTIIYYLAYAVVIAAGAALTLLHGTIWTAIGTSLIATGAAGSVVYLYIARTDTTREAIEMLSRFGLARIYDRRAAGIREEYAIRLEKARAQIDILGFDLRDFRRDYMSDLGVLAARARVRILLIDPSSPACVMRDREEDQREGVTRQQVEDFVTQFRDRYRPDGNPRLSVRFFTCLPLVNFFRIDDEIFWGPYLVGRAGGNTVTLRVNRGILYEQLSSHFEKIWEHYSRTIDSE
jgi:hypothetical protein